MKRTMCFGLVLTLIASLGIASDDTANHQNEESARAFVQALRSYVKSVPLVFDNNEKHPLGKVDVVFVREEENWDGSLSVTRVRIRFGQMPDGAPALFAPLQTFFRSLNRLTDISFDGKQYSMRLERAIAVPSPDGLSEWRGKVAFRFWQKVPWVVEISGKAPLNEFSIRQIKVTYIWKNVLFHEFGTMRNFWCPGEIIVFTRQRRGTGDIYEFRTLRERWRLEKIIVVAEGNSIVERAD